MSMHTELRSPCMRLQAAGYGLGYRGGAGLPHARCPMPHAGAPKERLP